jgi:hypothetical protein
MAHKKGVGSSRNGRDSSAQRLGVKRFGGQLVSGGWCASAALASSPVITWASAATTRSMHGSPASLNSKTEAVEDALLVFIRRNSFSS